MRSFFLILVLTITAFGGRGACQDLLGVFAPIELLSNPNVETVVRRHVELVDAPLVGTELTPVYANVVSANSEVSGGLSLLETQLQSDGHAILISRFEHDLVPVQLLDGQRGFAVRVYLTMVVDFFVSRAAFSSEARLETVHTIPIVLGRLYPSGGLLSREPDAEQIADFYMSTLEAAIAQLGVSASRDTRIERRRATRIFEVAPVSFSPSSTDYLESGLGLDGSERQALASELAYLLHAAVMEALAERGAGQMAIVPPSTNWSIANVSQFLDAEIGGRQELSVGAAADQRGMLIRAEILRSATLDGAENSLGRQRYAASEVQVRVVGANDEMSRPRSLPEDERVVSARGAGAFVSLVGVEDPPLRGMWRKGYRDAVLALSAELVDRMVLTSEEIR